MPLPEDARLMANGYELKSTKNYMIDRNGTVYAYIGILNAAVESEMLMACTADGQEIPFCTTNTYRQKIISYEETLKHIEESHASHLN